MKKNAIKKIVSVLLIMVMAIGITACGPGEEQTSKEGEGNSSISSNGESVNSTESSNSAPEEKKYIIGIAEALANDETVTRRAYLENYIAPNYNVEFIFSEALADSGAVLTFIENCADAGADAIVDFKSFNDAAQMAAVSEEYGMYYMYNGSYSEGVYSEAGDLFLGSFQGNIPQVAKLFAQYLEENASEDGSEGFVIASMLASLNNIQHSEITKSILESLQNKYDLTYEDTIENITRTDAPLDVANDKGIKIMIYPGSPKKDSWLPGISALLQTGDYGVVMSSGQTYTNSSVVIDEVEQQFNNNIKVVSVGSLGTSLTTAFETKDIFGNPSIDYATVKANSLISGGIFGMVYNGLTGYGENIKHPDGTANTFNYNQWAVESAEQLDSMKGWDTPGEDMWIFDTEMVDQLLGVNNPDIDIESFQAVLDSCTYESTLERFSQQ